MEGGLRAWGSEIRQTCQSGQCAYHEATSPREPREKASEIGQGWGIAIVIATVPLKAQEKWQETHRKAKDVNNGDVSKALLGGWRDRLDTRQNEGDSSHRRPSIAPSSDLHASTRLYGRGDMEVMPRYRLSPGWLSLTVRRGSVVPRRAPSYPAMKRGLTFPGTLSHH